MIELTLAEIAKAVDGQLFVPETFSDKKISSIVTDSRAYFHSENSLFFALIGPRNDGHNYIPELIEKGISAFVVSGKKSVSQDAAFISVDNTTAALQKLAATNRSKFNYPVVGITGSNGKTIVKEWLFELLSESFHIVRNPKSYNSQVGVPLSVLLMDNNYNLGIFEAGISKLDEMQNLAQIIKPDIGILTNIGDAHQENFNSKKHKTLEKLKLFKSTDRLIFRVDNKEVKQIAEAFCKANTIQKTSWSLNGNTAEINFNSEKINGATKLTAKTENEIYHFTIPFTDESSVENACHCFAAMLLLAREQEKILPKFENLSPVAMRLEIKKGINNCLLVNDYYNSDFTSLSIALSVLHQQAKKNFHKKVLILSDIQQTGIPSEKLYKQVSELISGWNIDEIIGIGPDIYSQQNLFTGKKKFYISLTEFERDFNRTNFSNSAILIKGAREFKLEQISAMLELKVHQTVLEINMNALVNNLNVFRSLLKPKTKIMVMVKAFSYGSGDVELAKLLQFQHVDYLAVAVADEGVELRNAGIKTPIVVMNPESHSFQLLIDYRLEPNIYSYELLCDFIKIFRQNVLKDFPVHLKLDTGMNRLGLKTEDEILKVMQLISENSGLKIQSVFSHLAASDEAEFDNFTKIQIETFEKFADIISNELSYPIDRHILNSAGIERFPQKQYEMVRLGIGLYGVSVTGLPLENISTLKSTVSQVKTVKAGETVGYGRKGQMEKNSKVAIVPMGYADGLDRKLGNKNGEAVIKGKRVPIIGNICMDMLMLDVSDVDVQPGDEVEFFGDEITIEDLAKKANTIAYEILTGISQRVKRVYLYE